MKPRSTLTPDTPFITHRTLTHSLEGLHGLAAFLQPPQGPHTTTAPTCPWPPARRPEPSLQRHQEASHTSHHPKSLSLQGQAAERPENPPGSSGKAWTYQRVSRSVGPTWHEELKVESGPAAGWPHQHTPAAHLGLPRADQQGPCSFSAPLDYKFLPWLF